MTKTPRAWSPSFPAPSLERAPLDDAQPYLRHSQLRPLTDNQEALLPELTPRLRHIAPGNLQRHVEDLARKVAQDIPARADLLRAYQRTSVTEVLAEYDARTTALRGIDNAPASVKTTRLTVPRNPGSAAGTALERPARPHTRPALGATPLPDRTTAAAAKRPTRSGTIPHRHAQED
jgi:hypothetical protein